MSELGEEPESQYQESQMKQLNFRNPHDKTIAYIEHSGLGQEEDILTVAEDGGQFKIEGEFDPYMFDA